MAGDELDNAIIQHIKKEYSLLLGERTAESIKITIGSAFDLETRTSTPRSAAATWSAACPRPS